MRSSDVRDDLQDGFDAAPMPVMASDGGPVLEAARPIAEPPPRLCEAGPCRHYHRMAVQLDAQDPMAERRNGKLVIHARTFHTQTSHYCYPDVGIETNLGSLPVLECNRWVPVKTLLQRTASIRADYDGRLGAWHDAREREAEELAAIVGPKMVTVMFTVNGDGSSGPPQDISLEIEDSLTIAEASRRALASVGEVTIGGFWRGRSKPAVSYHHDGEPITNTDVTLAELGLETGTKLTITLLQETKS